MPTSRYLIDLIDIDGTIRHVEETRLPGLVAVLNRVSQIGCTIEHPGCRIRVKDGNGSIVFVGVTTVQEAGKQGGRAA
jgi:hypothetical protein